MSLTPYSGTWGRAQVLHLLRRTMFGVKKDDLNYFLTKTMEQSVSELLTPLATPSPPVNDYQNYVSPTDPIVPLGSTWVNDPTGGNFTYPRLQSLRGWWIGLMWNQDRNIREKMVLFWHNHMPVSIGDVVTDAIPAYSYVALLRQHAMGNFKDLVRGITIEPSMLTYLDGKLNTRNAPNENYARELQELFTIGKDSTPIYTESDVQMAAKVLTGWQVSWPNNIVSYNPNLHDTSNKVFSSFYGNAVINYVSGATGGMTEINALLDLIFNKNEVALYIIRKLYRFFVYYKITADIETNIIIPLANVFRTNQYNILPVLNVLFRSEHFYDVTASQACLIKNPIDFVMTVARTFNMTPPLSDIPNTYKNARDFYNEANLMQMELGAPPNVAGWLAYWSGPGFHENWINADTLRRRKEFVDHVTGNWSYGYSNGMIVNVIGFTATLNTPSDPNLLIDEVLELVHTLPSETAVKTELKKILLSNQVQDYYWTTAWNNYVGAPTNTSYESVVKTRLKQFYKAVLNMAEFHLS
jgi:uncharacterized protein (DUF1800 family)